MGNEILPLEAIINVRKEKAVTTLSENYAKNMLPLEEYERLVEYISKIETERELVVVEKIVAEYNSTGTSTKNSAKENTEAEFREDFAQKKPTKGGTQSSSTNISVLASRNYHGTLESGAAYTTILGESEIFIRKQDLQGRETQINVFTVLGDCILYVEKGIKVVSNALPFLADAVIKQKVLENSGDDSPCLVVKGTVILGGLVVKLIKE